MGQKTNPIGLRVGVIRGWDSNWYEKKSYAPKLKEDSKLRAYIRNRLKKAGISRIVIDRTSKNIIVNIHTSRPGVVIGKSGKEITQLEEELKTISNKDVKVQISEIKRPELDAYLVAENIASQIEGRVSYRRAMKMAITAAMRMGAEGIRIMCSGRLAGAEIARAEQYKEGRIPLHTLRADIDYAHGRAETVYGSIGIKVWICRGEILGKRVSE
ncbi:Ribosomal protein S3 [Ignavibacterium album JCM 16511]|uniref:Small ribosomal subunit protein uS3 n=2 Tax=Ignavibacterium album TaxID=591197 RepID=I0AI23_IGNAJ|nr:MULTISPECIES: 30S ribosomal protein S3 [Ignavibacterium]AFH48630.1 Ribosomal protein S3 [Ignavibacterium album JCM 16511]MBI5661590.1 30S ribosomal protein S3 [Ignavibacterium album]MCA2005169.1 30S ribosomal protein S3 [Ignavibacterium sp.]MCL6493490.1 30S ribosomal protein S3 [Ignavibacterium sp.]MCX8105531.1 30S ribosomal protein S3 [Ignavibacterium album]